MASPRPSPKRMPDEAGKDTRDGDANKSPHKKNKHDIQSTATLAERFQPLYELALVKNEDSIRKMLWPAFIHHSQVLNLELNRHSSLSWEFGGTAEHVIPLLWVLKVAAREGSREMVNWLLQTFQLPNEIALLGYVAGGHENFLVDLNLTDYEKEILIPTAYIESGQLHKIKIESLSPSNAAYLLERYAEFGHAAEVQQLLSLIIIQAEKSGSDEDDVMKDDYFEDAQRGPLLHLLRGYARGGHVEKVLAIVNQVDAKELDDIDLIITYMTGYGYYQAAQLVLDAIEHSQQFAKVRVNPRKYHKSVILGMLLSGVLMPFPSSMEKWICSLPFQQELKVQIYANYLVLHPSLLKSANRSEIDVLGEIGLMHIKLMELSNRLGLPHVTMGACRGLTVMSSQSWLAYEEEKVLERLRMICNVTSQEISSAIASSMKNIMTGKFTEKDLNNLELQIFLEGASLAQNPCSRYRLFSPASVPRSQADILPILPLITSNKLAREGGMQRVCSYSGVYAKVDDFAACLSVLRHCLKTHFPAFTGRISICLGTFTHCLLVGYDAGQQLFYFNDSGRVYRKSLTDPKEAANLLFQAFGVEGAIILTTEIFSSGTHYQLMQNAMSIYRQTRIYDQCHVVTRELAGIKDAEDVSWLHVAISYGHVATVSDLLKAGADPRYSFGFDETPLLLAAAKGEVEIIAQLLDAGVNVDEVNAVNDTAVYRAVQMGHTAMVRLLLDRGARVDIQHSVNKNTAASHADFYREEMPEIADMMRQRISGMRI